MRSAFFFLFLVLLTPPYALLVLLCAPLPRLARSRVIGGWTRIVLCTARPLLGIRYRVEGATNLPREPAVVLSKHQSAYETLAFQEIFPPQVHVLKRELLWLPFFGWGLALMSPIAIDRSRGIRALRQIARRGRIRLDQGFWVIVFPEGTRVAPGKQGRYQPGGAWLAVHAGVPVVPVAHNAGLVWPRYAFVKYPGTVTFRIGPQIPTKGREPNQVLAEAEAWIETQQPELCAAACQPNWSC
ncbi:MAG: 1-acyl-sn-glycerol-3-phosphate acyltransferase [Betaproteobacteria bacterium]|nr:1-acyl-sn-glycerol-3-phosphate acyltransferase [Betaproteobacteria bacterium]